MNIMNNIFLEELKNFKKTCNNKENGMYFFHGTSDNFTVEIEKGTKPVEFKDKTFYFCTINGKVLTEENIAYLLKENFYLCQFIDVSLIAVKITSNFNQVQFNNCYFKKSIFDNIKLIGANFHNCDFPLSTFKYVNLEYTRFYNCGISYKQLEINVVPLYNKSRVSLINNLYSNAMQRNLVEEYPILKDALKSNYLSYYKEKTFFSKNSHYRKKLNFFEKTKFLFKYLWLFFEKAIFGFNLRIKKIVLNILLTTMLFSVVYWLVIGDFTYRHYIESLVLSLETLISKNNLILNNNKSLYIINYVHTIWIYILYGSFLAAIIGRIEKR